MAGKKKKLPKWPGWEGELRASAACPICGVDTPHGHYNDQAELEMYCRPTFERALQEWLGVYLPEKRTWRGEVLGIRSWHHIGMYRVKPRKPPNDYDHPMIEALWGLWLEAWLSKPSWLNAFDKVAMQKQIERQTPQPYRD